MAIKFFNIRSGEVRVAETEPHIAAMWGSSDRSPNVTQGQDFGWRLAPEVLLEMRRISNDENELIRVATRIRKNTDEVTESDILHDISRRTETQDAPVADQADYQSIYDDEVRRLSHGDEPTTTTTTKSIEQLEAELAARKAATGETVTTTTTKAPSKNK